MPRIPEPHNDLSAEELVERFEAILDANPTARLYVKWTCPNCGERAMSSDANVFHAGGYLHEDCGFMYHGDRYGFLMELRDPFRNPDEQE